MLPWLPDYLDGTLEEKCFPLCQGNDDDFIIIFKQYNIYLKKWFLYCCYNNIDIYAASVTNVKQFLAELFYEGAQYGTLHTGRSTQSLKLGS